MIPIVSIVGKSNSGKTTLIEKLIAELSRRGWRVATIKHNRHGFEIDHEGKDSWRHKRAGAVATVVASPTRIALIEDTPKDYEIAEIRDCYIRDADLILVEGYKVNPHPKIEVIRTELRRERLCGSEDNLIALTGDLPVAAPVPWFDRDDVLGIAAFIESLFLGKESGS
ncbi:MAG: molybdopterin-guanine dinucleotide biosynthesis protein B [Syntrophaceae bacterium]|nr:molybdopterin-guanine dinucleotide biosynthesis protein B [Syntrophaceae bacterium]